MSLGDGTLLASSWLLHIWLGIWSIALFCMALYNTETRTMQDACLLQRSPLHSEGGLLSTTCHLLCCECYTFWSASLHPGSCLGVSIHSLFPGLALLCVFLCLLEPSRAPVAHSSAVATLPSLSVFLFRPPSSWTLSQTRDLDLNSCFKVSFWGTPN